jgi:glycerol kinase
LTQYNLTTSNVLSSAYKDAQIQNALEKQRVKEYKEIQVKGQLSKGNLPFYG